MFEITKEFKFDAAHRLMGYNGQCKNIHGHTYKVLVTLKSEDLDHLSMVLDFGDLKPVKDWIDNNWDHAILLNNDDEVVADFVADNGFKNWCMAGNPTAETMAEVLFSEVREIVKVQNVVVKSVTVYESPTACACYF